MFFFLSGSSHDYEVILFCFAPLWSQSGLVWWWCSMERAMFNRRTPWAHCECQTGSWLFGVAFCFSIRTKDHVQRQPGTLERKESEGLQCSCLSGSSSWKAGREAWEARYSCCKAAPSPFILLTNIYWAVNLLGQSCESESPPGVSTLVRGTQVRVNNKEDSLG